MKKISVKKVGDSVYEPVYKIKHHAQRGRINTYYTTKTARKRLRELGIEASANMLSSAPLDMWITWVWDGD